MKKRYQGLAPLLTPVFLFTLVFLFSFTYAFSPLLTPVFAVEVQPVRLELTITHDQPTQGTLQIINHSQKAVQVQIQTGPYRFLQEAVRIPSAQDWFSFEPSTFSLGPKASTTVSYTITPPANLLQDTGGEYVAAILIDELPIQKSPAHGTEGQEPASSETVTVVPRFALPVYLQIHGKELIQVEINGLSLKTGEWPGLLRIETSLVNHGTIHVRPRGTVTVLNLKGGMVQSSPLGKSLPLFPTATLRIPTIIPLPSPGRYKTVVTVEPVAGQLIQKEFSFEVTTENEIRS